MENKTSKYLKYAIGEILLVVVGILIAVQINNWNESRKALNEEIKLVKQLLEDANADSRFFQSRIEFQRRNDTLYSDLINYSRNPKSDSIGQRLVNGNPFFFRLAFQSNLINNNPKAYDLISNDSIKHKLREYNARYEYVVHSIELSNRISEQYGVPLQIKYTEELNNLLGDPTVAVKDLNFITEDKTAISTIDQFRNFGNNYFVQVENFLVTNEELRQMLTVYLKENL